MDPTLSIACQFLRFFSGQTIRPNKKKIGR
jgi:hypothetical protein